VATSVANFKSGHEHAAFAAAAAAGNVTRNDVIHQVIRIIHRRRYCSAGRRGFRRENIRRHSKTSRERQSVGKLFDPLGDLLGRRERLPGRQVHSNAFSSLTQRRRHQSTRYAGHSFAVVGTRVRNSLSLLELTDTNYSM